MHIKHHVEQQQEWLVGLLWFIQMIMDLYYLQKSHQNKSQ